MVKRIVDTDFWTDMDVIDTYSPEDKYFYLYMLTNGKSSQVGIYSLPIKVMSFETGYSSEAIQVLLERFSEKYKQIVYSKETQEITILRSLQFSILKGGKPVSDLLERELSNVNDASLIQATYEVMDQFWLLSKRPFDKSIKELFENELSNRGLFNQPNQNQNENHNNSQSNNHSNSNSHNESNNHNHNQESWTTNRGTNREEADEHAVLESYANLLKKLNPDLQNTITVNNIVKVYYETMLGDVPKYIENQLRTWEKQVPQSLVIEALSRSLKASHPLHYAATIIDNWVKSGVETHSDVKELDSKFNKEIL